MEQGAQSVRWWGTPWHEREDACAETFNTNWTATFLRSSAATASSVAAHTVPHSSPSHECRARHFGSRPGRTQSLATVISCPIESALKAHAESLENLTSNCELMRDRYFGK